MIHFLPWIVDLKIRVHHEPLHYQHFDVGHAHDYLTLTTSTQQLQARHTDSEALGGEHEPHGYVPHHLQRQ